MNAFEIDAFDFCRTNSSKEGVTPVAEMTRLSKECANNSGEISWRVEGGSSKQGYPQMRLAVAGKVQLVCQRCLAPFEYEIGSSTILLLGKDDADADEIEEIIDDESIDVIVGARSMNLMDLVEDEALLAVPQSPKHEKCPDTSLVDSAKSEKASPFAGLKGLKTN